MSETTPPPPIGIPSPSIGDVPPRFRLEGWDAADAAKSLGSGLVNGVSLLAGLPGDVRQMIGGLHDQYVRPIEKKFGYQGPSPELLKQIEDQQPTLLPTSGRVSKLAEALVGQPHQPETDFGKLAYTLGQKIPGLPFFALTRGR
jgi:hypothetical protein